MGSIVRTSFIGRHQELTTLEEALVSSQRGAGRCVLVSGEAGIGKSRLLDEIRERAVEQGILVLDGRCFAQDTIFPYAPLVDILRPFLKAKDEVAAELQSLGSLASDLVKLLPELAPYFSQSPSSGPPETKVEKRNLFQSLTSLFWRQAEAGPLVLIIEDLHWSDQSSLEFLLYLVRRIAKKPILLLLTSRNVLPWSGLTELFGGLDREPIAQEIRLQSFNRAEVAQLLQGILSQEQLPSVEFVEAIYSLTEGNPFFAEEICTSLIASGDIYYADHHWRRKPLSQIDIPDSIQRVVQRRVNQISQEARRLIDLAAISGRTFDFVVLQFLTGRNDDELVALVKELMNAGLVVEENADQFSFRHALTREALYSQLLVRERQKLHGQLVEAIERLHADSLVSHLEALAYHSFEAGLWQKAVDYAQRAGEKALELHAPNAAVEQLTRAAMAAEQLSRSATQNLSLYRLRGQAFDTLGNFEQARADFETALRAAQAAGNRQVMWQVLLDLGLLWAARDYERTGDYCRQALDLARTMKDSAAIGYSLNRLGNWLMNSSRPSEALNFHREALDIFEALHDQAGIAKTLDLLAMTSNQSGELRATVVYYEQAIPILRELHDWKTLSSSLANLTLYTLNKEQADEAVKLAHDIGWYSGEAYALSCLSNVFFSRGRYGEGLTLRTRSIKISQTIEHPQWIASNKIFFGYWYLELLALTKAQNHLTEGLTLANQVGSTFFSWMGSGLLASVYILQGHLNEAEDLLAEFPQEWIPSLYNVRQARVELALAQKDAPRMLQLLEDLSSFSDDIESAIGMIPFLGPALKLKGRALLMLNRLDEAEQALVQAVMLYNKHGIASGKWRIYLVLGEIYLAASKIEQAKEMFNLARTQISTLAATINDKGLRENFLRRAIARIPAVQSPTRQPTAKEEFGSLTRRERQVAAVVAAGLTNQEIADKLVVSIKTVEAHVTRILSKLGFTSRAQIAAWAVDKGLAAAPQDLNSLSTQS